MKKVFLLLIGLLLFPIQAVYAADISYFDVKLSSDTAKTGQALDLTITAMDKDNNVIPDYTWTILVFSETDPKAKLPSDLVEWSYDFQESDEGSVKFENAVVFNSTWKHDLQVFDLWDDTDSVAGIVEIQISETEEVQESKDITITSPESLSTLTSSDISVAWKTVSNHKVIVTANEREFETISNTDGIYEVSVNDQEDGSLTLQSRVVNADEETIWRSNIVEVQVSANAPTIISTQAIPDSWETGYSFRVELISEPGLEKVEVILNDSITTLSETGIGKYEATFTAPDTEWQYAISVMVQNSLWVKTEMRNATTITVTEKEEVPLESAQEPQETTETPVENTETQETKTPPNLDISWLKLTKLKTKSILEWDPVSDADYYNIFIKENNELLFVEKVEEERYTVYITGDEIQYSDFVIRAVKEKYENNKDLEWDLSEAIKVQTGPEKYIFMFLLALIWSIAIFGRKFILRK